MFSCFPFFLFPLLGFGFFFALVCGPCYFMFVYMRCRLAFIVFFGFSFEDLGGLLRGHVSVV